MAGDAGAPSPEAKSGTYGLELEHVMLLCLALGGDATPADFVVTSDSEPVALSPTFTIRADLFRQLLRGWRWPSVEKTNQEAIAFVERAGRHTSEEIDRVWPQKPRTGRGYLPHGGASWGDVMAAERNSARDTEHAVARQLGLTPFQVALLSLRLWGEGLSERRDELAGSGAGPTARGHVTRRLIQDLRNELEENSQ